MQPKDGLFHRPTLHTYYQTDTMSPSIATNGIALSLLIALKSISASFLRTMQYRTVLQLHHKSRGLTVQENPVALFQISSEEKNLPLTDH